MANVFATKNGNWSDTTVWNTGALPTSADDVWANNFTIAANTTTTVLSIRNGSTTGVTAGGGFTAVDGVTLTLTGAGVVAAGLTCFASNLTTNQSCTIQGEVKGGTSSSAIGVNNLSSGTIYIIGSVTGGSTGGGGSLAIGVNNNSTGTVQITGIVTGGSAVAAGNNSGANNASTGTLIITGNVIGGAAGTNTFGAFNASTGVLTITGDVTSGATSNGAGNSSTGILTIEGPIIASSLPGLAAGNISQNTFLTGPFIGTAQGVAANVALRWRWALSVGPSYMTAVNSTATGYKNLYTADSTSSASGQPAATNVRSGTIYGPNSELTGTCAVPPAGSVALGVPVDNTTGTAVLTADSVRSAVGLASANLDAQLAAIPTTAAPSASSIAADVWSAVTRTITGGTVDTLTNAPSVPSAAAIASQVRTELATELGRLDAAITTRLAGSAYTTPPTASAIASAVNSALDRTGFSLTSAERQAIATAVEQSILNENDGQAILNAIVGAIGNQNVDQIALVAAIRADLERNGGTLATRSTLTAAQVRTELAPELGNLDATVSSRLASSGYTNPPSATSIATAVWSAATRTLTTAIDNSSTIAAAVWSAVSRTITGGTVDTLTNAPDVPTEAEIADAVRTELAPELARLSNVATTQEVGDIVEGALSG